MKLKPIICFLIAAFVISGAASFAVGQKKNKKTKTTKSVAAKTAEPTATPEPIPALQPEPEKKNSRNDSTNNNQQSQTVPEKKDESNALLYAYEFTQKEFVINHIVIEHDANGKGKITFEKKNAGEPITDPIEISQTAWTRIKALWEALNFLDSTTNYQSDKQFPHLGTMRLKMKQGDKERIAEFNWTNDKKAFELANEYRRIADQAIFVFDINLARDISPLDTPKMMNNFADMLRRNSISDPKQLLPLLRDISIDERLPLIARNHADRLVKQIEKNK
jgi:hypothetical protein